MEACAGAAAGRGAGARAEGVDTSVVPIARGLVGTEEKGLVRSALESETTEYLEKT